MHHNIPVALMDHLSPLFRDIFLNLKIAKGFAAAQTKTIIILNMVLSPYFERVLTAQMKESPFALPMDGSNDNGLHKLHVVSVRLFDPE